MIMRSSRSSILGMALLAALSPLSLARAGTLAGPVDLYETGTLELSVAEAALGSLGPWRVLHREERDDRVWLLLALPDGKPGGELPGAGRPRYLGRVQAGERVVLAGPRTAQQERLRTGRSVTVAPSGATVLVTREHPVELAARAHQGFQVLDRTRSQTPPRRETGPPASFRAALERASRVTADARGLRTRDDVIAVRDLVAADSLERYVRMLSERAGQSPASRFYSWNGTETVHQDSIVARFANALGPGAVAMHAFQPAAGEPFVHNVIAKHASPVADPGAVYVTAHYDAIGTRSDLGELCALGYRDAIPECDCQDPGNDEDCDWDGTRGPATDPAPGADDNATGVAVLLEAARLLAPLTFDFDLYFVAFQAEEIGLVGSAAYVDSLVGAGQEIFFCLNADMLGYNAAANRLDVVTNEPSEWLADWVVSTAQEFVPTLPVTKSVEFFGRSDHANFWSAGADAVLLVEDKDLPYPGYHSYDDVWETIFPAQGRPDAVDQFTLSTQLIVSTLARFAVHYDAPDLALTNGRLDFTPLGSIRPEAGKNLLLTARVLNLGSSSLGATDSLTARVSFYDGDPDAGAPRIAEVTQTTFFPSGGSVDFNALWTPDESQVGFHEIHAVVEGLDPGYEDAEIDGTNNRTSMSVFLQGASGSSAKVLSHYVFPNPVRGDQESLRMYYELSRPAGVTIQVFDLEGLEVGVFGARAGSGSDGNQAGPNEIRGSQFRWHSDDVKSGVYLYSMRVEDLGQQGTDAVRGKFAIVR